MKKHFTLELRGGDWWKPYLVFWLVFLAAYVPTVTMHRWGPSPVSHTGVYLLVLFAFVVVIVLAETVFMIVALRIIIPRVSIDGRSFAFRGSIGRFLAINVTNYLLTLVTLTVYAPWFARRIVSYLVSQITFDGKSLEFLGKGGRLFVYFLLAFWLPLIVVGGASALLVSLAAGGFTPHAGSGRSIIGLIWAVMLIILVPFYYLLYKWYVNIRWNDLLIRWRTRFWPSCGFLLGQILLTIVTVGIYWPAASLRIYRYFAARTLLTRDEQEVGHLGFDGSIGKGFGLLWGQSLLTLVTLGIYGPWAGAAIGRWVLGATWFEGEGAG